MRFLIFFLLMLLSSCKINQVKDKLREGVWVEEYSLDSLNHYKSRGKYSKGEPVKTWKYYKNGKLEKKEKYRGAICHTTYFYENGRKQSEGKTKLISNEKEIHWFYFEDWRYYSERGTLDSIKKY